MSVSVLERIRPRLEGKPLFSPQPERKPGSAALDRPAGLDGWHKVLCRRGPRTGSFDVPARVEGKRLPSGRAGATTEMALPAACPNHSDIAKLGGLQAQFKSAFSIAMLFR